MYSSSSSTTSQQHSTTTNVNSPSSTTNNPNLNTINSIYGPRTGTGTGPEHGHAHQFFSSSELITPSSSRNTLRLLHQGPYEMMEDTSIKTMSSCGLIRQSSSPAGLLSHLASNNNGYASGSKGFDVNYYNGEGSSMGEHNMLSRLGPQLSFIRNESVLDDERKRSFVATQSRSNTTISGFSLSAWDDNSNNNNSFKISTPSSKRGKTTLNDDFLNGLSSIDSEHAMDIDMMDRLMHVPQDSIACKIRAKRGCATHPRSIAERERRTRISGKLKKLQELVPNMDKQTSYADMLDLAVQHIKGLQGQIEKLNNELDHCTCGCKPNV